LLAEGRDVNRRHFIMIGVVVVAPPLLALWMAREEPMPEALDEPPGTQIVVQWFDDSPPDSSTRADPLLDLLYTQSQNLYVVDSFDLGGGTMNVFLYAEDPDPAVQRVIELFEQGFLPTGMRIGVADGLGGDPAARHYHPVYPPDLDDFQLIYAGRTTPP
jgi:hypothetical protein